MQSKINKLHRKVDEIVCHLSYERNILTPRKLYIFIISNSLRKALMK